MTNNEKLDVFKRTSDQFPKPFHVQGFDMHTNKYLLVAIPNESSELEPPKCNKSELLKAIKEKDKYRLPAKLLNVKDLAPTKTDIVKIGNSSFLVYQLRILNRFAKKLGAKTVQFCESVNSHYPSTFVFDCGAFAMLMPMFQYPENYKVVTL